ncbi:MAG: mevalonate kinase [Methanobacterium sp.]|uniref:mevalonate kinase n=1 Tax=Methanobacterium sp. TaxID=2164 RepID=UPI003D65500D|nr:mevalonate kinase [Methanobacterium sp.]
MQVIASAPAKAILFGEHAVVYGKPAIAMALNKKAHVKVSDNSNNKIYVNVDKLKLSGYLDFKNNNILSDSPKKGILKYILASIKKVHDGSGLDIYIDLDIPIGGGLGSSAAVTVATIAAVSKYNNMDLKKEEIAKYSHEVELEIQKAASPLDTTVSTYGGLIYLEKDAKDIVQLNVNQDIPVVIGYTNSRGNTGKLIEAVRIRKNSYPEIINPVIDSIETVTLNAKDAIITNDKKRIGELMNINHGLLDALGVNTKELSNMVYNARNAGAIGSKITGAGGGGSIIAYCPEGLEKVISVFKETDRALKADISKEGVKVTVSE